MVIYGYWGRNTRCLVLKNRVPGISGPQRPSIWAWILQKNEPQFLVYGVTLCFLILNHE
jgi:hypothetical protein